MFLQIARLCVAFATQVALVWSSAVMRAKMVLEVAVLCEFAPATIDQAGEEQAVARVLRVWVSLDFEPCFRDSLKLILL